MVSAEAMRYVVDATAISGPWKDLGWNSWKIKRNRKWVTGNSVHRKREEEILITEMNPTKKISSKNPALLPHTLLVNPAVKPSICCVHFTSTQINTQTHFQHTFTQSNCLLRAWCCIFVLYLQKENTTETGKEREQCQDEIRNDFWRKSLLLDSMNAFSSVTNCAHGERACDSLLPLLETNIKRKKRETKTEREREKETK